MKPSAARCDGSAGTRSSRRLRNALSKSYAFTNRNFAFASKHMSADAVVEFYGGSSAGSTGEPRRREMRHHLDLLTRLTRSDRA